MLLDDLAPDYDAVERHEISVRKPPADVLRVLQDVDLLGLPLVWLLLALRGLPGWLLSGGRGARRRGPLTLRTLERAGFGLLAEDPGRELVYGVSGRFWRPSGNLEPFVRESFAHPVPEGFARALWNFTATGRADGSTRLTTETRVVCGGPTARRRFRAYWALVRPFSGLVRVLLLRAVRSACESPSAPDAAG